MRSLIPFLVSSLAVSALASADSASSNEAEPARTVAEGYGVINDAGLRVIRAPEVPEQDRNPWSDAREAAFIRNYNRYLDHIAQHRALKVNTYFENEKKTYGLVMLTRLIGEDRAIDTLQVEDHQRGEFHRQTAGIDYYACFTIKHQMRKYFYFGHEFAPEYYQRMTEGGRAWTEIDPLGRPHYAFNPERAGQGWDPYARNSWVDVRTTDNLQMMRETSVYLMAEATGNEDTRQNYLRRLRRFVQSLYRTGNGEWDSHNYLGHAMAPLHNLYDFAQDREARLLAKAGLDWYYTTAALKYWRGNWNGPNRRDYNAVRPQQGSAPLTFGVHFAALHEPFSVPMHLDGDEVHVISSAYRPPEAVLRLAERRFPRPLEIWGDRPHYDAAIHGQWDRPPANHETHYYGHHFQFGTLRRGTNGADINGFKILVEDSARGAEMIQCVPGPDALYAGSPKYQQGKLVGSGRVGQFNHSAIYLVRHQGATPWRWLLPNAVTMEQRDGVTFLRAEQTWIALRPIAMTFDGEHTEQTAAMRVKSKKVRYNQRRHADVPAEELFTEGNRQYFIQHSPRYPNYWVMGGTGAGESRYSGFAIEIGEPQTHGDYASFVDGVLAQQSLDISQLADGTVAFTDSRGQALNLTFGGEFSRNGEVRDYGQPWANFRPADGGNAPVRQDWLSGTLSVSVDGAHFTCTVADDGQVTFSNRLDDDTP